MEALLTEWLSAALRRQNIGAIASTLCLNGLLVDLKGIVDCLLHHPGITACGRFAKMVRQCRQSRFQIGAVLRFQTQTGLAVEIDAAERYETFV